MSRKNETLRKKLVRLGVSGVVLAIVFALLAMVPAFQDADYEIQDNHLTVVRENEYYTNMDINLNVIDEKGNVRVESVKVYFEGDETNYTFDDEYFKNVLETEDDVYIIDVEDGLFTVFSNYTTFVSILMVILFVISMLACFNVMMFILGFTH